MNIADMTFIGSGAQADVYSYQGKAVKIYKSSRKQSAVSYEAEIQNKVYTTGIPIPKIYEITEIEGRLAIIMEYIQGVTIGTIMENDKGNALQYLEQSVDIQRCIHSKIVNDLPKQKDKLKNSIVSAPYLEKGKMNELLWLLERLNTGNFLCHGDFHVENLMKTADEIKIIDWVDASSGTVAADVCRTYLLYLIYREEIAEPYLHCYCRKSGLPAKEVFHWLPVIAAARLNENVSQQEISKLMAMVDTN